MAVRPLVFDNQTTKTSSKHRPLNLLPESSRKAKKIKHPRKIYHLMLETGNSTVTPVVSNLRIDPALVNGYLPFAHFFPSSFIRMLYLLHSSVNISTCLSALMSSFTKTSYTPITEALQLKHTKLLTFMPPVQHLIPRRSLPFLKRLCYLGACFCFIAILLLSP